MTRGPVPAAALLLAHTGELQLTDAQVVRLAAIARRTQSRRQSMRSSMDSLGLRSGVPADTAARRLMRERMRTSMLRMQEQAHADQRDAIAVLTADQQARAWNLVATRGRSMRPGSGFRGERGMRGGRSRPARPGIRSQEFRRERTETRQRAPRPPRPEHRPETQA